MAGGRLRAGWRIALYLLLFLLLGGAGQLASSLMPGGSVGWVGTVVLAAAALVPGWLLLFREDRRPPGALGFALTRAAPREVALGMVLGCVLIAVAGALIFASGAAHFAPDTGTAPGYLGSLAWTLLYFWIAAAFEEALFRGYAFQTLVQAVGAWQAVLLSSALFAWVHHNNPNANAVALGNIFLAGVLLALVYLKTRSLWCATAVHAGWNWCMASLLAFPVSGLNLVDTPLYDAVATGPRWWTGGGFGPEAGLAGTAVLVLGIAWVMRTGVLRESEAMRALRPLVDDVLAPGEP